MNILYLTYPLSVIIIFAAALGLGIFLTRRFKLTWNLWWIGAAGFILSQVGHIPFNIFLTALFQRGLLPVPPQAGRLVFNAVILGLSAGLWEELTRYAVYRWWAKEARSWGRGLLLGAGHGGAEAILIGAAILVGYIGMMAVKDLDLATLVASGQLPAEQLALAQKQVAAYWNTTWYDSLIGALERLMTLPIQLSFSVLVLQAFTRKNFAWVGLAILWHTLVDGAVVWITPTWGIYVGEAAVVLACLASLGMVFALRQPEPPEPAAPAPLPPPLSAEALSPLPEGPEASPEKLDRSRYL